MNNKPNSIIYVRTSFISNLPWIIFFILTLMFTYNVVVEPFPIFAEYMGKYKADMVFELAHKKQLQPNNSYSWRDKYELVWHIPTELGKDDIYISFSKPELKALLKSEEQYSNLAQNIIDRWNKE